MERIIKYIIAAAVTGFAAVSCNWLNVSPSNSVDETDLFTTGYGFRNALNGVYLHMGSQAVYGENLSWGFLSSVAQEYLTDASQQGSASYQLTRDAAAFVFNSTETKAAITKIWETQYSIIANINKIIAHIEDAPAGIFTYGQEEKDLIAGEAYALRAMLHFDLLRLFAPAPATYPDGTYLPYRDSFTASVGTKLTVSEFLEKVMADMETALPLLRHFDTEVHPEAMYASMMSEPAPQWNSRYRYDSSMYIDDMGEFFWFRGWRMNYLAALALQARICLYAGAEFYSYANSAAKELYNTYYQERKWVGFTPQENITCSPDLRYTKLSCDVLFGAYYKNLAQDYDSKLMGSDNSVRYPLAGIAELFASDNTGLYSDYRYTYTVAASNTSASAWYSLKYRASSESVVSKVENPMIPVIRFSEVCYILAELCARRGDISGGIEYLETVRKARGAERSLSLTVRTKEDLLEEILLDARKEFLCEGTVFYMYKRLNTKYVQDSSNPSAMKDMTAGYVLPVPTSENPF